MELTYRVPRPDELEAFMLPVWRGFAVPAPSPELVEDERDLWEPARSIGVLDGDEWVGGAGAFTMDLTLPGGAVVPAAGVTMVGVAPTHRRRGVLSELMRRQLDDVAAGPEPVAVLTASEAAIYGRFGYGVATRGVRLRVAPEWARLRPEVPSPAGRLRQVTVAQARAVLPAAYERIRSRRPGAVGRSEAWWETHVFRDRPDGREGGTALMVLVHEDEAGTVDGWATYRALERWWPDRLPESTLRVEDLLGADDLVHLELWRGLLAHDLYAEVDVLHAAIDDPLLLAVRDARRVRASALSDWLWLRILDVPRALGPRRWGAGGDLVVEVVDGFRPASGGRFRIEADADGTGTVDATDAAPDLTLGAEELGTVALGGVAPSALARVGRAVEHRPGALATADALFASPVAPHCATMF
ncbi:GNAT family N-acetyltransferase [Iamia majanohamensis]|uniref:GNAT family N-acetyltransferase n=1 Tax=Iamia majanohamensis TaxID=467976 RepID=A0AAF0BUS0_9ACTN|nr:GNAT family N-acetyltransferase [Iamia majanohamensis]WCO66383.1 GNAT family N-acetyltransferase [Iamia majanohamensis]